MTPRVAAVACGAIGLLAGGFGPFMLAGTIAAIAASGLW